MDETIKESDRLNISPLIVIGAKWSAVFTCMATS